MHFVKPTNDLKKKYSGVGTHGTTRIVTYNYNTFHFGKVNSIKMELNRGARKRDASLTIAENPATYHPGIFRR